MNLNYEKSDSNQLPANLNKSPVKTPDKSFLNNEKAKQFKRQTSILKMAPKIESNAKRLLAVKAENVCLTYGEGENTNYVLNGVCLNVPKGEIYGLLGPSGCGKTSILKILSGITKPEYGLVKLFGYTPGTFFSGVPGPGIGYMPQEIALQSDLTIGEMLAFYGRLCLLDESTISEQTDYLINLLELPSKDRLISRLSGGQKRRVSLAVTIIHKPRLVILDEPTVGVDPLLCQKIWELLIDLSVNQKMTIIITTHYIEECKRANLVGFMRKGQILSEGSPDNLIDYYNAVGLEDVFYKLCLNQKYRKSTVQATNASKRMSIIRHQDGKTTRRTNSQNSISSEQKKFERQGSFTSSYGEYQQQIMILNQNTSKYSTPLSSPTIKTESEKVKNENPFSNKKELTQKKILDQDKQLELMIMDDRIKYKNQLLEKISDFPIQIEKFYLKNNWNPIFTYLWLILVTSYKLGLQIMRQPIFLAILFLLPTFCIFTLYTCIGHTPFGLKVGLVNEEIKDHRHRFDGYPIIPCNPKDKRIDYDYLFKMYDNLGVEGRNKTGDYDFDYTEEIEGIGVYDKLRIPYVPDIFLSFVNQKIIQFVNYSTTEEAREATKKREIYAYVHFHKEFSRSFLDRDIFFKPDNQRQITTKMITQGSIHISGDFSDLFMSGTIQLSLTEAYLDTMPALAEKCAINPKIVKPPVEVKEFIYGEYVKGDYFGVRDFAAPGFIMCVTYSIAMALSTLQTLLELQDQMFVRNFSVGLSTGQIVTANIVGRFPFMIGSVILMLITSVNLFEIPIYGSYFDAIHILILQTLVGMINGLFFATFLPDMTSCMFLSIGFLLLIFFISGVFWPLESLPYYIRWFSRSMPFTVPGEAFRTVLIRNGAPTSLIYPGILMSYVWLITFLLLAYYSIRRKKFD